MDIEHIIRRAEDARNARANWDTMFQEIAERVLPQMAEFNTRRSPGEPRTEKMFDATAALAARKAVASIASFTWPSNQRYQRLTTDQPSLNKAHRVKVYFDSLTEELFRQRYHPRAAFEANMAEAAWQYVVFGTGLTFTDEADGRLRYKSLPLSRTYLLEGYAGQIDTVFRCFTWTLRQIEQRFPGKLPDKYQQKLTLRPDDTLEVWQCVCPRTDYDRDSLGPKGMPWASVYYIAEDKAMLEEGGFRSWPFGVMRDTTSPGEIYGRSAAWLALSSIKVLNTQKRTVLQAAQKVVDPPLLASEDGVLGVFSQVPGAVNFGGIDANGRPTVMPLHTGARIDIGLDMMEAERTTISGAFFLDVFRALIEHPNMTATQALELTNERAILMSQSVGRIESECLGPMTERELQLMHEQGRLPFEMPPELIEAQGEYKIEYTTPMRKAMRASEGIAIMRTLEAITPIAQVQPDVMDVFDAEEVARQMAEINGVPEKILRDPEALAAMKQARADQAQAAALLEAAPAVSATAANLTKMQAAGGRPQL